MHIAIAQERLMDGAVVISGAPRSGTTLLGKIAGSLKGLEYQFEPPTFYMICASYAMGRLSLDVASDLLRVYSAEDLLIEAVHGRGVNLRQSDDSFILNRLSREELDQRWQSIGSRAEALAWIRRQGARLAVKVPNIMDALPLLHHAMPNAHLVVVMRDGRDVVSSIIRKGWVTDDGLRNDLWPYHDGQAKVPAPYWVPPAWLSAWSTLTVESRACLMWTVHAGKALDGIRSNDYFPESRRTLVRYEKLLEQPQETASWLAARLGAAETAFTRRWLESVRRPGPGMTGTAGTFYDKVERTILEAFRRMNMEWEYDA
jgi:hypothetical protein